MDAVETSKKYLIYDNIVRGSGLGHFLSSYNYGLQYSFKRVLEYLPVLGRIGHGFAPYRGLFESAIGLPDCTSRREEVTSQLPEECEIVEYDSYPNVKPGDFISTSDDYTTTRAYFQERYANHRRLFPTHLKEGTYNICLSVRRGHIFDHEHLKNRIIPDSYFRKALSKYIPRSNDYHVHVFSDGDGESHYYIDQNRDRLNIEGMAALFDIDPEKTSYHTSFDSNNDRFDPNTVLSQFQSSIDADIFIGSSSGFSSIIALYRSDVSVFPADGPINFAGIDNVEYIDYR